jgi:hypothetical protein
MARRADRLQHYPKRLERPFRSIRTSITEAGQAPTSAVSAVARPLWTISSATPGQRCPAFQARAGFPGFPSLKVSSLVVERQYRVWQNCLLQMLRNTSRRNRDRARYHHGRALLAWAILMPPAFLWLGVILEQRRRRWAPNWCGCPSSARHILRRAANKAFIGIVLAGAATLRPRK